MASAYDRPGVPLAMIDRQRFDQIATLGNGHVREPDLGRLVRRGVAFANACSTCPACVAARRTVCTGREPPRTRAFLKPAPTSAPEADRRATATTETGGASWSRRAS